MGIKLVLPGTDRGHTPSGAPLAAGDDFQVVAASNQPGTRDAAASGEAVQPGDLIELTWEDGLITWERPTGDEFSLPTARRSGERGVSSVLLTAWQAIRAKVTGDTASLHALVQKADAGMSSLTPRLLRIGEDASIGGETTLGEQATEPILLFIHGTFSSIAGGFGGLTLTDDSDQEQRQAWRRVWERYGGRIYGFEHPTLSVSPVENARAALRLLPKGQRVDVVSHSRGGLVGELLSGAGAGASVPGLETLAAERTERGVVVRRHVRVASPVRGTRLASRRAEDVVNALSTLVNLIKLAAPAGVATTVLSAAVYAARVIVKSITEDVVLNPAVAPGLHAMMPDGPVVRAVNGAPAAGVERLIVGGVFSGSDSKPGKLLRVVPDRFFEGDNDLVVDTERMYTAEDREAARALQPSGPGVNHVTYFTHAPTRLTLLSAIAASSWDNLDRAGRPRQGDAADRSAPGDAWEVPDLSGPGDGRELVVLLPAELGSTLVGRSGRLWPSVRGLARGGLAELDLDRDAAATVTATGLVAGPYDALLENLRARFDTRAFPYDWRRPLAETAAQLQAALRPHLADGRRVHLVAHGMGAAVVQMWIANEPPAWLSLRQGGGRVVLLTPPLRGAWDTVALMLGEHPVARALAATSPAHDVDAVATVLQGFEGLLALMPSGSPWFHEAAWIQAGRTPPRHLADARRTRERLDAVPLGEGCCLVLGAAAHTRSGWSSGAFLFDEAGEGPGDGAVPYVRAHLDGLPTWYVRARHGNVPRHPDTVRMVTELLAGSPPSRGEVAPSVSPSRSADRDSAPEAAPYDGYPTEAELIAAAIGGGGVEARPVVTIRLRIVLGDMVDATGPMLAEYAPGVGLRGTLARLARLEGSPLPQLADAGVLPRNLGETYIARWGDHAVLVLGTGDPFDLTPVALADAVQLAVRRYFLAHPEDRVRLSTLLIGTGAAGVLAGQDSLRGLMEGFTRAVDDLVRLDPKNIERVGELEILNAYEDVVAMVRERAPDLGNAMETEQVRWDTTQDLVIGAHARPGRFNREERRSAWSTVHVSARDGLLRYTLTGRRTTGRVDEVGIPIRDLEADLRDIMARPAHGQGSAGEQATRILSRQIFPRDLRTELHGGAPLRLVLDPGAAGIPWEMVTEAERGGRPLVIDTPVLRALENAASRAPSALCGLNAAVVIGDEAGGQSGLSALPGAAAEAKAITTLLRARRFVVRHVEREAGVDMRRAVLGAIGEGPCRILHVASHGIHQGPGGLAGMLVEVRTGDQREPEYRVITADQLLNAFGTELPELVFFNCCHLGRLEGGLSEPAADLQKGLGRSRLAASVAQAFIDRGVRAVVAAGWAVNDSAASAFAETLYRDLLDGDPFGMAVRAAREAAWKRNASVNTWGAYQAYGDPDWMISSAASAVERSSYPREALALDIIDEAVSTGADLEGLQRIAGIVERSPAANTADVHLRLWEAFTDLEDAASANRHYDLAARLRPGLERRAPKADGGNLESLDFSSPTQASPPANPESVTRIAGRYVTKHTAKLSTPTVRTTPPATTPSVAPARPARAAAPPDDDPLASLSFETLSNPAPDRDVQPRLFVRSGQAEVTGLPTDLATGGYGPGSKIGKPGDVPLRVRALQVRDNEGNTVVLVVADLHTGTRLVHHEAVRRLSDLGLTLDTLVLAGTHTHTGPARFYGNTLYDGFTGGFLGETPRADAWRPIVDAVVRAVRAAFAAPFTACTVSPLAARVSGVACNRSRVAFPYKLDAWVGRGWPGEGTSGAEEARLVDARLRGMVFHDEAGKVVAVHALVACHNTAVGNQGVWDPDFVGRAMNQAQVSLGCHVSIALAGAGDQSPLPLEALKKLKPQHQGFAHAQSRADTLTAALVAGAKATPIGNAGPVRTRFLDWDPKVSDSEDLKLARWRFGAPMLGGAEDGRSPFAFAFPEGLKSKAEPKTEDDRLQSPKIKPAGGVLDAIFNTKAPAPTHALHQVEIGDVLLSTLPGEPTVAMAWMLECALAPVAKKTVLIQGYTGDYCGYFTTPHEYGWQQYEGASTIYGRNTAPNLVHHHLSMLTADRSEAELPPLDAPTDETDRGGAEATPPDVEVEAFAVGEKIVVLSSFAPDAEGAALRVQGAPPETAEAVAVPWGTLWVTTWADPGVSRSELEVTATRGGVERPLRVVTMR